MTNENAVATVEAGLPANVLESMGVSAQDMVVPRLLLMQNTSEAVGDDKAKLGDIINSQTEEVLGGIGAPVEIIPLGIYKTWRVMDCAKPNTQPEYVREEPMTTANEKDEWEFQEDGKAMRRDYTLNFFVLLKSEVDADEAFPCVLTFRRTSVKAGKQLATHLFKRAALRKTPYSQTVKIGVRKDKYETNTYAIFDVQKGEATDAKGIAAAEQWLPMIGGLRNKVAADEKIEVEIGSGRAATAPVVVGDTAGGAIEEGPY